jgi:hypothetical protein
MTGAVELIHLTTPHRMQTLLAPVIYRRHRHSRGTCFIAMVGPGGTHENQSARNRPDFERDFFSFSIRSLRAMGLPFCFL